MLHEAKIPNGLEKNSCDFWLFSGQTIGNRAGGYKNKKKIVFETGLDCCVLVRQQGELRGNS